ncbi:MAG TPA: pyridoxal 5'-phosphate synthase [Phycisphaerales bacterium]|nr:pyridoxal 5'-phosphate synthase [Phycisphaerales bacterium]
MVDPLMGRCDFGDETLPEVLPAEPFGLVMEWMRLATEQKSQPNPNAMTLATVDGGGVPSVRVVLARGVDAGRGFVTFYTNYRSAKGRAIGADRGEAGARVALGFFWDGLDRQVSIRGRAALSPGHESDAYFNRRPVASRIAAWASNQSQTIASRPQLLCQNEEAERRFGYRRGMSAAAEAELQVPRPAWWGGIRVYAESVQLWRGNPHRLHDRAEWTRSLTAETVDGVPGFAGGAWSTARLQP